MKKMLTLLVAGLMAVSMTACGSSSSDENRELIVASQGFNQMFMNSEALGNNSYDKNVRDLIYGYETYAIDTNGEFQLNKTAIKDVQTSETARTNEEGVEVKDLTYTFTLNDLQFSDGSAVTSDDYIFHLLAVASQELIAAEGSSSEGEFLVGHSAYQNKEAERFAGVKKIDDKTFSLTIDGTKLPYFWEYSLVAVRPDCMKAIAGDATIDSNEEGSKVVGDMTGIITNWTTTENKTPTVTAGPYKFVSFENKQVKLEINDKFAGDAFGYKPSIKNIVIKEVSATTDMDSLLNGEIDVLTDQIEGDKIDKAKKEESKVQYTHYSRNGNGTLPFHCDFGPTKEAAVRRAINYLLDKDAIVNTICGGYGSTINSDYSIAQWMWLKSKDELETKFKYNYAFSVDNANKQLDESSYRFEADGSTPFDVEKIGTVDNYYRYNSDGELLQINHLGTEDNTITDSIESLLLDSAPKAGIKFTLQRTDFTGLMDDYYYGAKKKDSDRTYHTFNMGSDFADAPDPYFSSYASEYAGTPSNPYNIKDEKLDTLMQDLRHTDKDDRDGFLAKWEAYEIYFNELLPVAPTYANDRHSFATVDLDGFKVNSFQSWAQTICQMSWK